MISILLILFRYWVAIFLIAVIIFVLLYFIATIMDFIFWLSHLKKNRSVLQKMHTSNP